ncbi:MAG TPA: ParA family protein [Thermoanaerobaculia bacterium]|nr:ParA family protein [Thermoanaerobaculia bacterium]
MILSLLSKKGGVGKTTTAVSLAASFAHRGHSVLLIDLDSQASASLSVGLAREDFNPSSADVLLGRVPAREARRPTAIPRLQLIPASSDLLGVDLELGGFRNKERRLAERLESLRDEHELIVIDCPPSLSLLPINALVAADRFLLPIVPQFLAAEGLDNLLSAAHRITSRVGSRTELLGMLLTMVDYRLRSVRETVTQLRESYGSKVLAIEIRINTRLAEAPAAGRTIFDFDPGSAGARAYDLLTDEIGPLLGLVRPAGDAS